MKLRSINFNKLWPAWSWDQLKWEWRSRKRKRRQCRTLPMTCSWWPWRMRVRMARWICCSCHSQAPSSLFWQDLVNPSWLQPSALVPSVPVASSLPSGGHEQTHKIAEHVRPLPTGQHAISSMPELSRL